MIKLEPMESTREGSNSVMIWVRKKDDVEATVEMRRRGRDSHR